MKKLFSAAASLVMAATMVGAVSPVSVSAADAKKSLSFLPYKDTTLPEGVKADGATVTVSADAIAAGDVVIPVAMYLSEDTADLSGFAADATVKSDNADVSKIKFKAYTPGADSYFSSEKEFKAADGSTFKTDTVVAFAGSYDRRDGYVAHGAYSIACAESQTAAGTDNAFVGMTWTNGGSKYAWHGEKSDTYPIVVFDVTLPKGIANGEYVIDYCNYKTAYGGNQSCLLESTTKYSSAANNLDLNTLTIKVGDAASSSTTTTASTQTTATTTTSGGGSTTTTTTVSGGGSSNVDVPNTNLAGNSKVVPDSDVVFDFTNPDSEDGYWRIDPEYNEVDVDIRLDTHGKALTVVSAFVDVEGGFTGTISKKSPALNVIITPNNPELGMSIMCQGGDGYGTVASTENPIVASVYLDPTDIPDGLYKIRLNTDRILRILDVDQKCVDITVIPGYIAIGDVPQQSSTTTTSATTTSATTTSATTTASSAGSTTASTAASSTGSSTGATTTKTPVGAPHYGDTNCDGSVKINDVVLLNKWLNDNKSYDISDQGKLNADCYNPKGGEDLTAEDSDAIIKSIVHLVELPVNK